MGLLTLQLALLPFPARPGPTQETRARKSGGQWVWKALDRWTLGRGKRGSQDNVTRQGKAGPYGSNSRMGIGVGGTDGQTCRRSVEQTREPAGL